MNTFYTFLFYKNHPYGHTLVLEDKKCTCATISATKVCNFCIHVKYLLNIKCYKFCVEKFPESILNELIITNEYSKTIKSCELFFRFNRVKNMVLIVLDNPTEPKINAKTDYCYRSSKMSKYTNTFNNYISKFVSSCKYLP